MRRPAIRRGLSPRTAKINKQAHQLRHSKALDAAFRRRLFRGEDGQRIRQQHLDDEWDGISESAA
ncbi:hypothetical protein [Streptomyces sp. NPDC006668]|uniref:hypothetical protein n=1 Tax=Streptomyces sp. NPDC006668 TaxID=3156903 RepID=UPI0033DC9681